MFVFPQKLQFCAVHGLDRVVTYFFQLYSCVWASGTCSLSWLELEASRGLSILSFICHEQFRHILLVWFVMSSELPGTFLAGRFRHAQLATHGGPSRSNVLLSAAPRDTAPSAPRSVPAPWLRWYIRARSCRPFGGGPLPPLAGPGLLCCDLTLGCLLLGRRGQGESWEGQRGRGLRVILKQGEAPISSRKQEAVLQATSASREAGVLSVAVPPKSRSSSLSPKQGSGLGIAGVRIPLSLEPGVCPFESRV